MIEEIQIINDEQNFVELFNMKILYDISYDIFTKKQYGSRIETIIYGGKII